MVLTPANNWAHSGKALGAFSCVKIEARRNFGPLLLD
jgi:hypothetical protein